MMKLYTTSTSPYARVVKILLIEKGLEEEVKIVEALTRRPDSPYYDINVSGRVPYLQHEDGMELEDSREICAYLDSLDNSRKFVDISGDPSVQLSHADWQLRQLLARATSLIDSVSVWVRELRRAPDHQSPIILEHERTRSLRLARWWEQHIHHPNLQGPVNLTQATLYCALDLDNAIDNFLWREQNPQLVAFANRLQKLPSIQATSPYSKDDQARKS